MIKPDQKILKALCTFQSQFPEDYRVLQQWFLDSSAVQDERMRNAEPPHLLYRAQGGSKELLELCKICATPQELAGKLAATKAGIHIPD